MTRDELIHYMVKWYFRLNAIHIKMFHGEHLDQKLFFLIFIGALTMAGIRFVPQQENRIKDKQH